MAPDRDPKAAPTTPSAVQADRPIKAPSDDALGRLLPARSFAHQLLSFDAADGLVAGVLGPWGSGKTSFINLSRSELGAADVTVLDFNPWMFSGEQQLVESFFVEVAAQLKLKGDRFAKLGDDLEEYGEIFSGMGWLPVVGPWIERGRAATSVLSKLLQRRKEGISGRKTKLEAALRELEQPIVVVLDDIDRLTTPEIRDIFKLVRLTASLPNIIYLLAFDRARVEDALSEQGIRGRDYLEKILQITLDLPAVPPRALQFQIGQALDVAFGDIDHSGPFDDGAWLDILVEIVSPLVRNMRDVRRYAAAAHGAVVGLDGQVALEDVLGLEAVRVFLPDVFAQLHSSIAALTAPAPEFGRSHDSPQLKQQIDLLLDAGAPHQEVIQSLVKRLFPAARHLGGTQYGADWAGRWLRERKVAHADVLSLYLERSANEGFIAFTDAERAFALMTDHEALDLFLRSIDAQRCRDVISSLEIYQDRFVPEQVIPTATVLLNLYATLPSRPQGMFGFDERLVISRVVIRLMRTFQDDASALGSATRQILPNLDTLSAKFVFLTDMGHREGAGQKFLSEAVDAELLASWRAEVRKATPEQLAIEPDLFMILLFAKRDATSSEPDLAVDGSGEVTLALFRSARSDIRSQSVTSRAVRRKPVLPWDELVEICGSEETLKARIEDLSQHADDAALIELAKKYADGWRPMRFNDD